MASTAPTAASDNVAAAASDNDNDDDNDDTTTKHYDGTATTVFVVPPLASHGITLEELQTAIRVLRAVATLTPSSSSSSKSKSKQKQKRKVNNNNESNDDNSNSNIVEKKQHQQQEPHEHSNDDDDDDPQQESSLKAYKDPSLRSFRKALSQCIDLHHLTMYDGRNIEEYYRHRNETRSLKRQKLAEQEMQRKHLANTALRRGRIERLKSKQMEGLEEETYKHQQQQQLKLDASSASASTSAARSATVAAASAPAMMMIPDGHVVTMERRSGANSNTNNDSTNGNTTTNDNDNSGGGGGIKLPKLRSCYVCKTRFRDLHHFYDQLCPECATLNWHKRHQSCDLNGQVAVVTGCRVKIGYQTCLKLLRAGATVIATTRFPNAAVDTYRQEDDFEDWKDRLQVFGLDLRDVAGIEAFCHFLKTKCGGTNGNGLDILINNACQTIRRPREYYLPACQREEQLWRAADDVHKTLLTGCREFEGIRRQLMLNHQQERQNFTTSRINVLTAGGEGTSDDQETTMTTISDNSPSAVASKTIDSETLSSTTRTTVSAPFETTGMSHSAAASQMVLLPEDVGVPESVLPKGATDINGQQLDLRQTNSWLLKMDQVSTPEVMECMFVNAIAPFVLNSRLKPLMCTPTNHGNRYIVNVSAMEGKFYRYKLPSHPHTNMAKAALNMMTRTSAEDLATNHGIFMNAIDTGWINDENPLERAKKTAEQNNFQTPIDEIDAAARIVDPIFCQGKDYGKFLKDYRETEW